MNILVVNGSPSGKNSITLHTALYLEKKFPDQSFSYLNAAQTIHSLQKDFSPAVEALEKAELIAERPSVVFARARASRM